MQKNALQTRQKPTIDARLKGYCSDKIAILGGTGSGKTVFLTVLASEYGAGKNAYHLDPVNKEAGVFLQKNWAKLKSGEFPPPTPPGKLVKMHWRLYNKTKLGNDFFDLHAIDVAGECYRELFNNDVVESSGAKALEKYIKESGLILILINLKEIINDSCSEETLENIWGPKACIELIKQYNPNANVAILLSQKDTYETYINEFKGNLIELLRSTAPNLAGTVIQYNLPIFPISSVNNIIEDEKGDIKPAPDFKTEGINNVLDWLIERKKSEWFKRILAKLYSLIKSEKVM